MEVATKVGEAWYRARVIMKLKTESEILVKLVRTVRGQGRSDSYFAA